VFSRNILIALEKWRTQKKRKPLVLRGARQVGKTTVIHQFALNYEQYIYINLELEADKRPFEQFTDIETLLQTLFFVKNKKYALKDKTLLFIDEIQEVPEAFNMLRYFLELAPEIHVIAAGSLLETIFDEKMSFPVGRVEYMVIRPVSFPEFLEAIGEQSALEQLNTVPLNDFAHEKLLQLFHKYALIGGMPEVVSEYAHTKDLTALSPLFDSLINGYLDDVEKYARSQTQVQAIRHTIRTSFSEAGKRIKFHGFGKSNYGSKEMGEALRTLEKALFISLIYPTTSSVLPIVPELKKSPRLQMLDSGMMNYFLGVQTEILGTQDLTHVYHGTLIEHLVGQELLAIKYTALSGLNFWVREKNTSSAELDYIYPFEGKLIPIEVKSGKAGKLKSLHLFMNDATHDMAIRFYAGKLNITLVKTSQGKSYQLLSLPYYLVSQIDKYLTWFKDEVKKKNKE
jgi:predicted AAA+ superfamily ATPase